MASFLLLVVFLLFGSFSARAQAGYSPPGARTATGRLKTKVDRLSSLVETLQSQQSDLTARVDSLSAQLSEERDKNSELALNLTQTLHKLDSMTSTLYEHDSVIKQRLQCTCENPVLLTDSVFPTENLIPVTTETSARESTGPVIEGDCAEYYSSGRTTSGVYRIGLLPGQVEAYCDMDTAGGGWTVIQRRQDGSVPFNRTWEEYKHGFGNKNGEYWLGNENIHLLTSQKNYTLRVDLGDWEEDTRYATYSSFRVSGESDQYRLHISGYSGDAGVSMSRNNGQRFSTVDRDNDVMGGHCSQHYGQAGWWFGHCGGAFLNGRYLDNCAIQGSSCPYGQGVLWVRWMGSYYSMKSVSMKIRPY